MARRSALVDHQMKHIPKSFNREEAEISSPREHTGRVAWLASCSTLVLAISDEWTHSYQYREDWSTFVLSRRRL
jgi:nitric oxide synthase oxygenase domain/subunit